MKKIIYLITTIFLFFLCLNTVEAKDLTVYFFYSATCPHCAKEEVFLDELETKYDNLTIERYEVTENPDNAKLMDEMQKKLNINNSYVPLTIVEDSFIIGFSESRKDDLTDLVEIGLGLKEKPVIPEKETEEDTTKNLPLLGKIDVKNTSLLLISVVLGLVDGFNPCAMWVLLFLISTLISMNNKKRRWILGITFLTTSALFYMLIMMSWLNIVVNIGMTVVIRIIIAIIALVGAFINLKDYFKTKNAGCTVVSNYRRKIIFSKIKKFTSEKNFFLALLGVITLAISVNVIELACSAGIPIIFSSILSINKVSSLSSFLYTLVYIFFFLIDDLIVFTIAMLTLKVSGISNKYSKYSKLIGGILMFIIGILLIFKPEWIMFNF